MTLEVHGLWTNRLLSASKRSLRVVVHPPQTCREPIGPSYGRTIRCHHRRPLERPPYQDGFSGLKACVTSRFGWSLDDRIGNAWLNGGQRLRTCVACPLAPLDPKLLLSESERRRRSLPYQRSRSSASVMSARTSSRPSKIRRRSRSRPRRAKRRNLPSSSIHCDRRVEPRGGRVGDGAHRRPPVCSDTDISRGSDADRSMRSSRRTVMTHTQASTCSTSGRSPASSVTVR